MINFHLDGSEVSWLVYADWLEDQGKDASSIRYALNEIYHTELSDIQYWMVHPQEVGGAFMGFNRSFVGCITDGSPYFHISTVGTPAPTCNAIAGSYFETGKHVGIAYQT